MNSVSSYLSSFAFCMAKSLCSEYMVWFRVGTISPSVDNISPSLMESIRIVQSNILTCIRICGSSLGKKILRSIYLKQMRKGNLVYMVQIEKDKSPRMNQSKHGSPLDKSVASNISISLGPINVKPQTGGSTRGQ